ncbi:MAG: NADH-quinone oxidoreductase subunit NuoN [Hyphomicrobiaceae bacterium]
MIVLDTYAPLWPEMVLALGAMSLLMYGVFRPDTDREGETVGWLAIGVLALAAFLVLSQPTGAVALFDGAFLVDDFGRFMKILVLTGSAAALLLTFDEFKDHKQMKFEFPVLVLLATAGMTMMISAGDLIALYLGLELQSLALYVMAAFRRDSVRSSEAGLKYFVLGALSSGFLLYGASLIYGFTGSTSFVVIADTIKGTAATQNIGLVFGLVFLMVGLAFKVSAVPFHMWTPDVYEGAPTPVTAFFAAAPKVAAMALLVRVVFAAFPGALLQWQQIVSFLAIASMLLGAFAAIGQRNIKRLMAYSSIANIGFALVGLAAGSHEGASSVLIYMAIYMAMTLGAFACILSMRRADGATETIDDLSGLAQNHLGMAFVLAVLLFSLAGLPPLAGFFAKFYVFLAAIKAGLYTLAVIGVLASVVGAYYYVRIVKVMFFDEAKEKFQPVRAKAGLVMGVAGVLVLFYVLVPAPLVDAAGMAARTFRY